MTTRRRSQIIGLICNGNTDPEISAILKIGEETITTHMRLLYGEMGARNRAQAAYKAVRLGIATYDKAVKLTRLSGRYSSLPRYVAQGLTNKEIGRKLGLSEDQVKTRFRELYRKIGISTRSELAAAYAASQK